VDFDGDGIVDLISGSYDPGELYWFKGLGSGRFEKRRTICGRDGKPVVRVPDQKQDVESFGSWVDAVDWDADGDLDLVFGGFGGEVVLRVNEGTRTAPLYATSNVAVEADGKPLAVPGSHGAIVAADWDGDGLFDLVLGSANGGVYWCRNVGAAGTPKLEAPAALVPPHDEKLNGYDEWREPDGPPVPGIRAQIDVVDWDGDGRLDLLVGDFRSTVSPRRDLDELARARLDRLRRVHAGLSEKIGALAKEVDRKLGEFMATLPRDRILDDDVQQQIRDKREELQQEPMYAALSERCEATWKEIETYLASGDGGLPSDDRSTAHGLVWLYVRR